MDINIIKLITEAKKKTTDANLKATDIIIGKDIIPKIKNTSEFKKDDLRFRKKPIGVMLGLNVWVENSIKDYTAYIIDRNTCFLKGFDGKYHQVFSHEKNISSIT